MPKEKSVTMQNIADKLGVTKVTVSKALGNKDGVSDELREKIKKTAEEMGYKFNFFGQALKSKKSFNIGVIVSEKFFDNDMSFYYNIYKKLCLSLDKLEYTNSLHILTEENEINLVIPNIITLNKIDGLIILGKLEHNYIKKILEENIQTLFLDYYTAEFNIDCVITDNFFGSYFLTNYLLENDFKDFCFVGSIKATSSIQDRYLGYCKALIESDKMNSINNIIEDRDEHGNLINIKIPEKLPEAFVCNCDITAYHLCEKLKSMNINVPNDVSVVGFDNDIFSTLCNPKLTSYEVNIDKMVSMATKFITKKMTKTKKYGRILVEGQLVIRESVNIK